MPLYEYECDACGRRFERIQKFSDPPETVCPTCGGAVRKLLSSPAIQFKGSGFYITDYVKTGAAGEGGKKPAEAAEGGKKPGEAAADASKSASATESKSTEGKSTESASKTETAKPSADPSTPTKTTKKT
jgi:putative FmdB family regulatory protein